MADVQGVRGVHTRPDGHTLTELERDFSKELQGAVEKRPSVPGEAEQDHRTQESLVNGLMDRIGRHV